MYLKKNNDFAIVSLYTGGYEKKMFLREISRRTSIPLKTTQNTLKKLMAHNILKSSYNGKNKYFELNRENVLTKLYVTHAEMYKTMLFLEKYPEFKMFVKEITTNTPIIAFGSFARFKADKNSDADILIVASEDEERLPSHLLPHKIHQITLSEDSFFKSLDETFLKEVEDAHVILNNHSFYVNSLWRHYGKK